MRTTLRLEDDLMAELRETARRKHVSVNRLIGGMLRERLAAEHEQATERPRFRQRTAAMGRPRVDLTKALSLAFEAGDEATLRKLGFGS